MELVEQRVVGQLLTPVGALRAVALAGLWFNHRRLFESCGDIPPAELEAAHYRQHAALTEADHSTP